MPVLLAIMRDGASATGAALYDPVQDRIVTARPGDTILGREVVRITPVSVELRAGAAITTLTLEPEPGGR